MCPSGARQSAKPDIPANIDYTSIHAGSGVFCKTYLGKDLKKTTRTLILRAVDLFET